MGHCGASRCDRELRNIHHVCQVARPPALVIRLLRGHRYEIAHRAFFVLRPIGDGNLTNGIASVRAIDWVHNPAPDLECRVASSRTSTGRGRSCTRSRAAPGTRSPRRGQELAAVDYLHHAVTTGPVGGVDAVKSGARSSDGVGAVAGEDVSRARASRDGAVDTGYRVEVGWYHAARLLPVKRPISEEVSRQRVIRVAEIHDEHVLASSPPIRRVIAASAYDVRDPRVALPPAFMGPREVSNDRVPPGHGAHTHGLARVRHVP